MQFDYIIVGFGLAGMAFAETLERKNKRFIVFDLPDQNASQVAVGMYNPIILKRLSVVYDAESQMEMAKPFYKRLEEKFKIQVDYPLDIYRIFQSVAEQNDWFSACDHPFKANYLIPQVIPNTNPGIIAPYGFGQVSKTGKIATEDLVKSYKKYLKEKRLLRAERFNYSELTLEDNQCHYKDITARKTVFCEGHGVVRNRYFNWVPLKEAKGELLTIYAPDLKCGKILKSGYFVIPLGEDYYSVGATYNWQDKSPRPTEAAKREIEKKLNKIITVPYEVTGHKAGIRPTVKDRRPLLGIHAEHKPLAILNGLGTRGVMLAPKMANLLFEHLEENTSLPVEVDIKRFT